MPPPRKVDLLPPELRAWLRDALVERGFAEYEALAEELNFKLEEDGLELRIGKSALHAFGQEFRDYAEAQKLAQEEIRAFLQEAGVSDEVDITSALFQQLTTIQFRLQVVMSDPNKLPDPRGMKDLTTALNNLIRSTDLRQKLIQAALEQAAESVDAKSLGITAETAEKIKANILGIKLP